MHGQPAGINSLISVRAGVAGQPKHMTKPPEAAIGLWGAPRESGPRSQERKGQPARFGIVDTHRDAGETFSGLPSLQGAKRHARTIALAADAGYRDCSCRGV